MTSVTYLQQTDPSQLRPARRADLTIARVFPADPAFNAHMYRTIGADWGWTDRLGWTEGRWASYCSDPAVTTFRAKHGDETVGYAELRMTPTVDDGMGVAGVDADGVDVELVYFGLLPHLAGNGLGGRFLSEIVRIAWQVPGCRRVWLHTAAEDSPAAIPNYVSRGFVEYHRADSGCEACTA